MSGEEPMVEAEETAEVVEAVDYETDPPVTEEAPAEAPVDGDGDVEIAEAPTVTEEAEAAPVEAETPVVEADAPATNGAPAETEVEMAAGEPEAIPAAAEGTAEGAEGAAAEATEGKEASEGTGAQVNGVKPAASTDPLSFPPHGTEVFMGGVPRQATTDQLRDFASEVGEVFAATLPMNPVDRTQNRGFGFVKYKTREAATAAMEKLTQKEMKDFPGFKLRVSPSQSKYKLYVGKIPRELTKEELEVELKKHVKGLEVVELLMNRDFPGQNRGFCFLEFYNSNCAEEALRILTAQNFKLKDRILVASFAEAKQQPETPSAAAMATVKAVYVGNLPASATEDKLREVFAAHGTVSKVVIPPARDGKDRNYGFVHFEDRAVVTQLVANCEKGVKPSLDGNELEIKMAKPQLPQSPNQGFQPFGRGMGGRGYDSGYPARGGYAPRGGAYGARGAGRAPYGGGRGYAAAPVQQAYDQSYYGAGYEDPYAGYGAEAYGAGAYDYSGYDYSGYDTSGYAAAAGGTAAAATTMVPMMLPNGQVGYVLSGSGAPAGGYGTSGGAVRRGGYSAGRGAPAAGFSPPGGRGGRRGGAPAPYGAPRYRPY